MSDDNGQVGADDLDNELDEDFEGDPTVVVLEDADGQEFEFVVVSVYEHEGREYAMLEPKEDDLDEDAEQGAEDDDEAVELVIMAIVHGEDGEETLAPIEDDEYDRVFDAYVAWVETLED